MITFFVLASSLILITQDTPALDSSKAKAWDQRREIVDQLARSFDKVLRKNSRAVRRGADNPRVNNLLKSQIDQVNKKLRARKLAVHLLADSSTKTQFQLTTPEIEQVLNKLNPYQRDFAESSLQSKKVMGRLLHFTNVAFEGPVPDDHKASVIDLEKPIEAPAKLKSVLEKYAKAKGSKYVALVTNRVPLPNPSYSLKSEIVAEQKPSGEVIIYHQRMLNRDSDKAFAQVYTELPPAVLLVRKSEFFQDVEPNTKISHLIIDTYDTNARNP
jgi:hypothetical protein